MIKITRENGSVECALYIMEINVLDWGTPANLYYLQVPDYLILISERIKQVK